LPVTQLNLSLDALRDQVAVVTGAGRGIGREVARALAALGARVIVAEISEQGSETAEIIRQSGGAAHFVQCDVSDAASVAALIDRARQIYGPIDLLVNNAAYVPVASVAEMEAAIWDRVLAVNLRGTFLLCKAVLPDMLSRRCGVIVNMVSTEAMPGLAAYIASKQGIAGFSQSLAAEVGAQGVRVIAFGPGMVDTPGLRAVSGDLAPRLGMTREQFLSVPLHPAYDGLMPPEDSGAATAYLIARLAEEYHGEIVNGYQVLERAGYLQSASGVSATPVAVSKAEMVDVTAAIALSEQLQAAIAQTAAEFDQLPIFVRPMARNGFKSKAGQSINDWTRAADQLTASIKNIQRGDAAAAQRLRADAPRLIDLFHKLLAYYQGVPAQAARFTKDAEFLRQVAQQTAEREVLVRSIIEAVDRFHLATQLRAT
jgi:NAD(P)-dependent dehydrogenase (short-subunit alcohol dehydrogenase family)